VARILIVAGGCRGRTLARALLAEGHAVRITTRRADGRGAIEAAGAECWLGTPDRLATLRGVLDSVAVALWALGTATGEAEELAALHSDRLRAFLTQAIDSTARAILYERAGAEHALLDRGAAIAEQVCARNAIPLAVLDADPDGSGAWAEAAQRSFAALLAGR